MNQLHKTDPNSKVFFKYQLVQCLSQVQGPVRKVELHRYKHDVTGMVIKVNPNNLTPFYKLTAQAKYFLRGRSVKEVIEEGLLEFDGEKSNLDYLLLAFVLHCSC